MIKDAVVSLPTDKSRGPLIEFAVSVATAFNAHLTGAAFSFDPPVGALSFPVVPTVIDAWIAEIRAAADRAKADFDRKVGQTGLSSDSLVISGSEFDAADAFARLARSCDLSIIAQPRPDEDFVDRFVVDSALFRSGRPVLLMPYIHAGPFKADRILVCWDGSQNAARAVGDAAPFLKRARNVEVITIRHGETRTEIAGADIAQHLARHGLKVELKTIVTDTDVANTVLSHVADNGIDLIVMGGYGHSQFRELILGGATQGILDAMTVPTLMAH